MRQITGLWIALMFVSCSAQDSRFNIVFHKTFENNKLGYYDTRTFEADWFGGSSRDSDFRCRHHFAAWCEEGKWPCGKGYKDSIVIDSSTGSRVLEYNYPEGCVGPATGDLWHCPLVRDNRNYQEIYWTMNVKFKPGFDFNWGGKLMGIGAGPFYNSGSRPEPGDGARLRLMFNRGGELSFYSYFQNAPKENYGYGYLWRQFKGISPLETGKWMNITVRLVMNTIKGGIAYPDGFMEGFINGELYVVQDSMIFLDASNEGEGFDWFTGDSFFGGNQLYQAAQRDEWIHFDDICVFTYSKEMNVPRGHEKSPEDRILILPVEDKISQQTLNH